MSFIKLWASFQALLRGYEYCFDSDQGLSTPQCQNFLFIIMGIIIVLVILYGLGKLFEIGDNLFKENKKKNKLQK